MKPIVEFCVNNIVSCSQGAFEKLEKDRSLDVVEYNCISFCTRCAVGPMSLVNGELVTADTNEALVEKVYELIDENG